MNKIQQSTSILSTTYLDVPPMITCLWLGVEVLVLLTIIPVQMLCVPDKVGGNQWVVQHVECPIPQWPNMYLKGFCFLLILGCDVQLRELSTKNMLEL